MIVQIMGASHELTGENTKEAKKGWRRMRRRYLLERAILEPTVFMTANENWLEFSIRYLVDLKKRRSVKDLFYTRIVDEINKTDGKVSIASTNFILAESPPIDVRITKESGRKKA